MAKKGGRGYRKRKRAKKMKWPKFDLGSIFDVKGMKRRRAIAKKVKRDWWI